MEKRYFTVEEANGQVPTLESAFQNMLGIRILLKSIFRFLDGEKFAPDDENFEVEVPDAPLEVLLARAHLKGLVETLRVELGRIKQTGCVIKDAEVGLVDWFAKKDGEEILLCWRLGEKQIGFWHDRECGVSGRRSVDELAPGDKPSQ